MKPKWWVGGSSSGCCLEEQGIAKTRRSRDRYRRKLSNRNDWWPRCCLSTGYWRWRTRRVCRGRLGWWDGPSVLTQMAKIKIWKNSTTKVTYPRPWTSHHSQLNSNPFSLLALPFFSHPTVSILGNIWNLKNKFSKATSITCSLSFLVKNEKSFML